MAGSTADSGFLENLDRFSVAFGKWWATRGEKHSSPESHPRPVILKQHNGYLQSMRGLAALSALIGHSMLVLDIGRYTSWINSVFQQGTTVVFFYVLSGFVLGESLRRVKGDPFQRFLAFAVKRLTRLLPVLWASVLLGILVLRLVSHPPLLGAAPWFNYFLTVHPPISEIVPNLLAQNTTFNGVLWSVQVELIMVMILPVMEFLTRSYTVRIDFIVLAVLSLLMQRTLVPLTENYADYRFVAYLNCFYLGIMLPKLLASPQWQKFLTNGVLICIELLLYVLLYRASTKLSISVATLWVFDALVSAHLIAYVILSHRYVRFLQWRPLLLLGDISYSFYAYSVLVITVCAFYLLQVLPAGWRTTTGGSLVILGTTLGLSLAFLVPISWASYRWIEQPFIRLGHRWAALQGLRWAYVFAGCLTFAFQIWLRSGPCGDACALGLVKAAGWSIAWPLAWIAYGIGAVPGLSPAFCCCEEPFETYCSGLQHQ